MPQRPAASPLPDVDPAASSSPPISPAARWAEGHAAQELADAISDITRATEDRATRHALLLTATALERRPKVEVISVIGGLLAGLPVAQVLGALEDLASSAVGGGERS
jgi:hypothetical protein